MAWFLSRNKSKSGSKRGSKSSSLATPKQGRKVLLTCVAIAISLAALFAAWHYGEKSLRDYVTRTRPTAVTLEYVKLANQPGWMNPQVAAELRQLVHEQLTSDPFDRQSLTKAAGVLAQVPWVEDVRQVRRLGDGSVEIDAVFREPFAVIEARDGYHLVDTQAVRLPGLYRRERVPSPPLPLVVGVESPPPAEAGSVWRGDDVQAALNLVEIIKDQPFADQVVAYDVSSRDRSGRVRLALLTQSGRIEWGYPPGAEMAIEQTPQVKIDRLLWIASKHPDGQIDGGGKHLDITGPEIREYAN